MEDLSLFYVKDTDKFIGTQLREKIRNLSYLNATAFPILTLPAAPDKTTAEGESLFKAIEAYGARNMRELVLIPYHVGVPATMYLTRTQAADFILLCDGTQFSACDIETLYSGVQHIRESINWNVIARVIIQGTLSPPSAVDIQPQIHKYLKGEIDLSKTPNAIYNYGCYSNCFPINDLMYSQEASNFCKDYKRLRQTQLIERYGTTKYNLYRSMFRKDVILDSGTLKSFPLKPLLDITGTASNKHPVFIPLYWYRKDDISGNATVVKDMYSSYVSLNGQMNIEVIFWEKNSMAHLERAYEYIDRVKLIDGIQGCIVCPRDVNKGSVMSDSMGQKVRSEAYLSYIYGPDFNENPAEYDCGIDRRVLNAKFSAHYSIQRALGPIPAIQAHQDNSRWMELISRYFSSMMSIERMINKDQLI